METITAISASPHTENSGERDNPNVILEPASSFWSWRVFREVWTHRELLYFLVWRDLKVRYKQTALGVAWVVLQPLVMTIIFTIVFGRVVLVPTKGIPYPLFAYSGLVLWTFFSGAISVTSNCLVANAHLITKVYFPRFIIPLASTLGRLVDLFVSLVILVGLMLVYRIPASPHLAMVPLILILLTLFGLGFGLWTSAVNVKYRDVGLALPVLIQLWMFASPVVYPLSQVPPRWQKIFSINPLVGILENFRSALFGTAFNLSALMLSTAIILILLVYGAYAFHHREKAFADII